MLGSLRPLPTVPMRPPEPVVSRAPRFMRIALCMRVLWLDDFAFGAPDCSMVALPLFAAGAFSAFATETPASNEIAAAVAIQVFIAILQTCSNDRISALRVAQARYQNEFVPRSVPN